MFTPTFPLHFVGQFFKKMIPHSLEDTCPNALSLNHHKTVFVSQKTKKDKLPSFFVKSRKRMSERLFKFNSAILLWHLFPPLFSYFLAHSFGYGLQNELRRTKKSALANF
ncbi:MAG: hypothetical protein AAGN35_27880, partial [Bacteroidota bacterium]